MKIVIIRIYNYIIYVCNMYVATTACVCTCSCHIAIYLIMNSYKVRVFSKTWLIKNINAYV